jgi:hypothetical protein
MPQKVRFVHFTWTVIVGGVGYAFLLRSHNAAGVFIEGGSGTYDWFKATSEIVKIINSAEFEDQKLYLVIYFCAKYFTKIMIYFLTIALLGLKIKIGAKFYIVLVGICMSILASYFGLNLDVFVRNEVYISLAIVGLFIFPKIFQKFLVGSIPTPKVFGAKETEELDFISIVLRSLMAIYITLLLELTLWRFIDSRVFASLGIAQ